MGVVTRMLALIFIVGTIIGSVSPEFGNILAHKLDLNSHYFNRWFLVAGLLGIVGFGLALYFRFRSSC